MSEKGDKMKRYRCKFILRDRPIFWRKGGGEQLTKKKWTTKTTEKKSGKRNYG